MDGSEVWRVSAYDLERLVSDRLAAFLDDRYALAGHQNGHVLTAQQTATLPGDAACDAVALRVGRPAQRLSLMVKLVERIELGTESIVIRTSTQRLAAGARLCHRDQKLINVIREAHAARRLAMANPDKTISGLARTSGRCRNRLARYLTVSSLAPDIVTAILQGRQPIRFLITQLLEADLPLCWQEQRRLLGFT